MSREKNDEFDKNDWKSVLWVDNSFAAETVETNLSCVEYKRALFSFEHGCTKYYLGRAWLRPSRI